MLLALVLWINCRRQLCVPYLLIQGVLPKEKEVCSLLGGCIQASLAYQRSLNHSAALWLVSSICKRRWSTNESDSILQAAEGCCY